MKLKSYQLPRQGRADSAPRLTGGQKAGPLAMMLDFLIGLKEQQISPTILHAMLCLHLCDEPKIILKDLARHMGFSTAAMTSVADSLEHHGFAKRMSGGTDRRQVFVGMTPKGRAFIQSLEDSLLAINRACGMARERG